MESKEGESAQSVPAEPVVPAPAAETTAGETVAAEKKPREPEDPETAAKRKAERAERRKEQRKAARQASKEAKVSGAPAKPRAGRPVKEGELAAPEGAAPKISVAKVPAGITVPQLKALFEPHGTILRADVSKRQGRPTIGTVVFNTHGDVRRAYNALHGKHKCEGEEEPISIQYSKDSAKLGGDVKKATDAVADCIREYSYKAGVLRSKDTKDFLNKMLLVRKNPPATEVMTAALLVIGRAATADELVECSMVKSAGPVLQLLKDEKIEVPTTKAPGAGRTPAKNNKEETKNRKEEAKPASKLEKTFDAVVPKLDKLEKERWNKMAKANLRLNERHRFRFVDILATPSLELWRWMVEDCELTPAEAGTCFCILQNNYGVSK